jgi:UDP-galactopyranose mutase
VVSSAIKDVVRTYGHLQGVHIAHDAEGFIHCCEKALEQSGDPSGDWLAEADLILSASSWDTTQARMAGLISQVLGEDISQEAPALLVAAE